MRCDLFCDKRGAGTSQVIGTIVLLLLVLFGILYFFVPGFWDGLGVVTLFGGTSNNIFNIENECELACLDGDVAKFCNNLTSRSLRLGDGRSIKGSCEAISKIGSIGVFDGVRGCSKFSCQDVTVAVCSKGFKKYDCGTWLNESEIPR